MSNEIFPLRQLVILVSSLICPLLNFIQVVNISLVLGAPKLVIVFQIQPYKHLVEKKKNFSCPNGYCFDNAEKKRVHI